MKARSSSRLMDEVYATACRRRHRHRAESRSRLHRSQHQRQLRQAASWPMSSWMEISSSICRGVRRSPSIPPTIASASSSRVACTRAARGRSSRRSGCDDATWRDLAAYGSDRNIEPRQGRAVDTEDEALRPSSPMSSVKKALLLLTSHSNAALEECLLADNADRG